jgi:RNA polymerase sigma-70 factor (ECF subfamily)
MAGKTEQTPSESPGDGRLRVVTPPEDGAPLFGPDEIRRIWREHRRWVAAILLAHKPREIEVDDLLQVVAMSVVRKIGSLRDPAAVKPWLRTVAINAARASGREVQRKRRHLRLVREREIEGEPTGDGATRREEAQRLMALARTLPEGYREPLLMRCVRGMSYKQIGAVLDLPETTIETRIARGRRMLRELASQRDTSRAETAAGNPEAPARRPAAAGA